METSLILERAAGARLIIDLGALAENYRAIARRAAPAKVGAVVKANGYGLGAIPIARVLEEAGCERFFVAHLAEGLSLKSALSPGSTIFVLNGLPAGAEPDCAAAGLVPVLNSLDQVRSWRDQALELGQPLPAALQVDSGMSRLGLSLDEVDRLAADDVFLLAPIAMILSHLACADEAAHRANAIQKRCFLDLADRLPSAPTSLANSGGAFLGRGYHGDIVRAGIALYGVRPSDAAATVMAPVVRLEARVIQVRDIPEGQGVGYGWSHVSSAPARIATLSIGYADGWPRALSNVGAAYFQGVRLPIVGRVSMDSLTLDISALALRGLTLGAGDFVELIGEHQSLEDVANDAGTIPYEILTRLGDRYHRIYHAPQRQAAAASQFAKAQL